ncbi:MAG: anaerobic glycerol-3-phosphate dehydrogenase subunit A [Muribaculaceae bacterium]|nr:anaerobic glycerol-3-phosphate dehydrogenase subunit A [Muribaculaceae bacterium]
MTTVNNNHYDVIVIGGGITGAGTARDCAMRGLKVLLVERHDFSTGATGRNHGLMHSGARYAVTDHESAKECIQENMILRKIAKHCVEETDGLFITLPEDDINFQATFVQKCTEAGISAEIIDPKQAILMEPSVNPELIGAVKVPDASIDPFRLTMANVLDAQLHGAEVLVYHEVIDVIIEQDRMVGVKLRNNHNGETLDAYATVTVNAAGIWGALIAQMAGVKINMFPAKGSLLIFGHRVNHMVINRCRKPANADILVPDDAVCVIGTTSLRIPIEECDDMRVTPEEVEELLAEGMKLAPSLGSTRILRGYAGVRPLVASDDDPSGRSISRGIVTLDHEKRDGLAGFITITGGKMMTYRLMAEEVTNLVCQKLNINKSCETATTPLPGSEPKEETKRFSFSQKAAQGRHGTLNDTIERGEAANDALVCECEGVSVGEVRYAVTKLHVHNLINLRRRTRVGMGTCQGELCACRAAGVMCNDDKSAQKAINDLNGFINERWKGMQPVAWGDNLAEAQLTATIYQSLLGVDKLANERRIEYYEI